MKTEDLVNLWREIGALSPMDGGYCDLHIELRGYRGDLSGDTPRLSAYFGSVGSQPIQAESGSIDGLMAAAKAFPSFTSRIESLSSQIDQVKRQLSLLERTREEFQKMETEAKPQPEMLYNELMEIVGWQAFPEPKDPNPTLDSSGQTIEF